MKVLDLWLIYEDKSELERTAYFYYTAYDKASMTKNTKNAASQRPFETSAHKIFKSDLKNRAIAAKELAESARTLKEKAEQNGLKMIAYLLNLVELEAIDCQKYIAAREQTADTKKA